MEEALYKVGRGRAKKSRAASSTTTMTKKQQQRQASSGETISFAVIINDDGIPPRVREMWNDLSEVYRRKVHQVVIAEYPGIPKEYEAFVQFMDHCPPRKSYLAVVTANTK